MEQTEKPTDSSGGVTIPHIPDVDLDNRPSPAQRKRANIQFVTLCWTLFLAGWNDGTTGPLLPRIQEVYGVCVRFLLSHSFANDTTG